MVPPVILIFPVDVPIELIVPPDTLVLPLWLLIPELLFDSIIPPDTVIVPFVYELLVVIAKPEPFLGSFINPPVIFTFVIHSYVPFILSLLWQIIVWFASDPVYLFSIVPPDIVTFLLLLIVYCPSDTKNPELNTKSS